MKFINCTPHPLALNDGRVFPPSGILPRVQASFEAFDELGITRQVFGQVENLPEPEEGTLYVVSALVLSALAGTRPDVVAPATGHPDTRRNDQGHILSVPGFTR